MKTAQEALRASKLGPELTEQQLDALAPYVTFRDLADGQVLVAEGTSDNHLYGLMSGALDVVRNAGKADGVTLFALSAGDLVGELSFIDGTPHYAALVASGPTKAHAATKRIVRAYCDGGIERADEVTAEQFAGLFATEDLQNAVRSFLAEGPGKATFEGK